MQNKKYLWFALVAALVIALGWFAFSPDKGSDGPVKVGLIMPLSGDLANLGANVKRGLDIAFDESGFTPEQVQIIY